MDASAVVQKEVAGSRALFMVPSLEPPRHPTADMMRRDWYYALLFPLTLPVTVVAVYLHWLSMKLFKHA